MQVTLGLGSHPITHGRVQPEQILIPKPAADTGFTYELSTAYNEWPAATLAFTLATDANAGNRQVALKLLDPAGNFVAAMPVASTQAASLTYEYCFLSQLSNASAVAGLVVVSPLFDFVIPAGYQIVLAVSAAATPGTKSRRSSTTPIVSPPDRTATRMMGRRPRAARRA